MLTLAKSFGGGDLPIVAAETFAVVAVRSDPAGLRVVAARSDAGALPLLGLNLPRLLAAETSEPAARSLSRSVQTTSPVARFWHVQPLRSA